LIRNASNLGFTGGMNAGIAAASGQYVYLTEDDIVTADDCLAQFVDFFQSQPQAALASGILYNRADRSIRCAGGSFVLGGVFRKVVFGAGERDHGQFAAPFPVDYVPGCMLFARTEFLKEIGGFREDFFMYFDDLELCARIRKAGHRIVLVPAAKAYHMDAGYPTPPLPLEYHKLKNFVATYFLHAPWSALPVFISRYGLWALVKELLTDRRRFADTARAWWYALRHLPVWLRQRGKGSPARILGSEPCAS
jgi:hypothetical protein